MSDPAELAKKLFEPFDAVAIAKQITPNVMDAISKTLREGEGVPDRNELRMAVFYLLYGTRTLLPVGENRTGVPFPKETRATEPAELQAAQTNLYDVFSSGQEATPEQRGIALKSIHTAAEQLAALSYKVLAKAIIKFTSHEISKSMEPVRRQRMLNAMFPPPTPK
ncbi:MAG: hypothetical protein EB059_02345 [Alphaproteobacteria bacterium]|nr:hypothetical protein [Alphaproteobacteria bacterium]